MSPKVFYAVYFWMICLYVIILRLVFVPASIMYALYCLSLVVVFWALGSKGLKRISGKGDIITITAFFLYYLFSSLTYVVFEPLPEKSWIFKDLLYSLLPILFYIFIRLTKLKIEGDIVLKITLVSIVIIDFLSLILFFARGSFIFNLFNQELIESASEAVFALSGVLGVIITGFINVIGLAICVLSPVSIKKSLKISVSLLCIICILLAGQRTPIGGMVIVILFALLKYKLKGILIVSLSVLLIVFFISNYDIQFEGFSLSEALTERYVRRFENIMGGNDSTRDDQQLVIKEGGIIGEIFGSGVGNHSPENPYSRVQMPDAMMYRIYNEMGVVGVFIFCMFFLTNFLQAIKKHNKFILALLSYIFIANFFNRVLFTAPISSIPYIIVALYNWKFEKQFPMPSSSVKIHSL